MKLPFINATIIAGALVTIIGASQVVAAPEVADNNPLNFTLPQKKKLLEFGWDQYFNANPSYIRDNIRTMEKRPFDGIIFRLADGGGEVFKLETWDEAKLTPQLKVLSEIKWSKFTDNFVYLMAASSMDWASDEDWDIVTAHTRFCARAARAARCKGLVIDPEAYGFDPWVYGKQKHAATMTFNQYQTLVRKRGAQFMQAIQSEMPDAVIPMLHMFQSPFGATGMADSGKIVDPVQRYESLKGSLHIAFLNGMLDVMGPGITLIDGNEPAYYYESPEQFYRAYHAMRQSIKMFVAAENQDKFDRQVRAGQALYVDHIFNTRPADSTFGPSPQMTPEQRAQWFARNVYHALDASDGYAWLYSESMNWWKNEKLPPGMEAATLTARARLDAGKLLDFDSGPSLVPPTSEVSLLPTSPSMDGANPLSPLAPGAPILTFWDRNLNEAAPFTSAQVAWDRKNLYLDLRCYEPEMAKLKTLATKRDSASPPISSDDHVEVFISPNAAEPEKTFHYIVNAGGALLDSKIDKVGSPENVAWNGNARITVRREANRWTARLAIPWADLGVREPGAGHRLAANICRTRYADGKLTQYGWAPLRHADNYTPDDFGIWTLQDKVAVAPSRTNSTIIQPAGLKSYGSGASLIDLYYDGGVPGLGLFVGQANTHVRNDRVLCKFNLIPLLEAGSDIQKVELVFGVNYVTGKKPERDINVSYFPNPVDALDARTLAALNAQTVTTVKVSSEGSFTASQAGQTGFIPHRVDVTPLIQDALAKGRTLITFRWQDDEAERNGNPDATTTGTLLSGVESGGLPSLAVTMQ